MTELGDGVRAGPKFSLTVIMSIGFQTKAHQKKAHWTKAHQTKAHWTKAHQKKVGIVDDSSLASNFEYMLISYKGAFVLICSASLSSWGDHVKLTKH